ncbi:MAG: hypothetical protein COX65_02430 [Elusimicrobia bacterium CG_4_10_14_0_2_um_filter_56_8]|nr:MAG: hypothetical protein AUJ51_10390 [Elusimicrobia bacterium CG1_02_56_21]PJA16499.1 MAG: hypothetical protein COX65_02430 [Elusimicrobia bacterium CG_4_10_14_0_2_um_filter_56_8]
MKPRYQIVISLSEDDNVKLQQLREDGFLIVDIFRLGLTEAEAAAKKTGKRKEKPGQDKLF